jgi:predicted  nucleic acid-binding Zn-ribbon protein
MQKWTASRPHVRLAGLLGAFALLAGFSALDAQSPAPPSPARFDPSDVYFQGYLAARSAEQLEAAGDFSGALEKLEKANQLFEAIRRYHPQWKPEMVGGRSVKTMEATSRIRPLAEEEMRKNRNAVAELEGGITKPGEFKDPDEVLPLSPGILEVDPLTTRRLEDAEAEVRRLRDLLDGSGDSALREASRVGDLKRQRDDLQARLRAAETTVQGLRARLMAAPMENEMSALNRRIETLEQEREAMALALRQSRDAHTEALARIATLQTDLEVAQQQRADLERNLKTERKVANSVVAGQRRQLDVLERELAKKNTELGEANQRIAGLMNELKESRDAFGQLRDERDSLLRERDQMAALLKLNEAGRIQELIEQNMALAKNLREANEKVDRLFRESNADKDAYTDALRDLAIAKSQINRLHQEKREQDQRLADLEDRLRNEEPRARHPPIPPKLKSCATSSSASSASRNAAARRATCWSMPPRISARKTSASPRPSNSSTTRKSRSRPRSSASSTTARWMASSSHPSPATAPRSVSPPPNSTATSPCSNAPPRSRFSPAACCPRASSIR